MPHGLAKQAWWSFCWSLCLWRCRVAVDLDISMAPSLLPQPDVLSSFMFFKSQIIFNPSNVYLALLLCSCLADSGR